MRNSCMKLLAGLIGVFCIAFVLGCHHEVAKAQPQPAVPQPSAPTATLAANPAYIERGQSTTLSWQTTNATDINIQGLGTVQGSGTRTVYPPVSTSYELTAKGPGGTADASARVTVNAPLAKRTEPAASDEPFAVAVQDVYFDYDRFNIRPDQMSHIQADARYLQRHDGKRILIEGHCDERGSEEYNLALGAKRAESVENALVQLGVTKRQLQTVSYGKERPFCDAHSEQCWSQNRRGHFTSQQ